MLSASTFTLAERGLNRPVWGPSAVAGPFPTRTRSLSLALSASSSSLYLPKVSFSIVPQTCYKSKVGFAGPTPVNGFLGQRSLIRKDRSNRHETSRPVPSKLRPPRRRPCGKSKTDRSAGQSGRIGIGPITVRARIRRDEPFGVAGLQCLRTLARRRSEGTRGGDEPRWWGDCDVG